MLTSKNFEFLRTHHSELAIHAAFAEQYAHSDPASGLVKLRTFAEIVVDEVYHHYRLPRPYKTNLNDLLREAAFESAVPRVVRDKLHLLRKHGNEAAHGGKGSTQIVLRLLQEAFDLGRYLYTAIYGKAVASVPAYKAPTAPGVDQGETSKKQLQREKKALLEQLEAEKARMQEALDQAEKERKERAKIAQHLERTAAELEELRATQQETANALGFSEAETRQRFIDTDLLEAGWPVDDRQQVGCEVPVKHQPTKTGKGSADYVLWGDNGKPLAVIEAKKTSRNADEGRTQALHYADGLEREWGQRPVIFYTNGYDTWLWDDAQKQPPRRIFGYYSKDSLEKLHFQRQFRQPAATADLTPTQDIAGYDYQIEAIKRVAERFDDKHRKALLVMATGTGKTRVAVALTDLLLRSNNIKNALFICDRRELSKQAQRAFREHLPGSNPRILTRQNVGEVGPQVFVATYQTMMDHMKKFDVGFFDLIIADESHRSVYNYYGNLFRYFDALQLGLTATPVDFIDRNTFELFGCEEGDATSAYRLEDAIADRKLVPPRVKEFQTAFQRKGIKYSELSKEQRIQLEQQLAQADTVEYESSELDRRVLNKDTNRQVLRNLMENGICVKDGTQLGKTIIFARNHDHAVQLKKLFDELYPAYGGGFCEVIDYRNDRRDQLIDDFKGEGERRDLTIAISVDMLDTGVDVPEVVNLVFAKPVKSYVKFWQMIGRGTRLCRDLFGPGDDKREFLVFDHWKNFEYFDERYEPPQPAPQRSLQQRVFEARLQLAEAYNHALAQADFERTVDLILADLRSLALSDSIEVREHRRLLDQLSEREVLLAWAAPTQERLGQEIAPLMRWAVVNDPPAWRFDQLVTELQHAQVQQSSAFPDLKAELCNRVEQLRMNLTQVKAKASTITQVRDPAFWEGVSSTDLERVREELRGVMQYQAPKTTRYPDPVELDIKEDLALVRDGDYSVKNYGLDLVAYRHRVTEALERLVPNSPTLQKIQRAEPVDEADIDELCKIVLSQNPHLDLKFLHRLYPETSGQLAAAIRRILGVDRDAVEQAFAEFLKQHPGLNATQVNFVRLLKRYILDNGGIEREKPYEAPFDNFHSDGLDGVFPEDTDSSAVMTLLERFFVERSSQPPPNPSSRVA